MMDFSKHFAKSQWCQFDLDLCLGYAIDNDDALIVVCLGDVVSRDLTGTMMAVLKTTTYIQCFWGRLLLALNGIMPAVPLK